MHIPPWARYESLLSRSDFVMIVISISLGRLSAQYRPEHPLPTISTSVFIVTYLRCKTSIGRIITPNFTTDKTLVKLLC